MPRRIKTSADLPGPSRSASNPRGIWVSRFEKARIRERPGVWFRLLKAEDANRAANHARNINHKRVMLPEGEWEAHARTDPKTKESYVWVQYLGDGKR